MAYKLVLRWKNRREERPLVGTTVRLGRDATNEIVVEADDRSVSRFHARLDFDGKQWQVVDTQSRNRVQVNGRLIPPGDAGARYLNDGDLLLLGSFEAQFVREEDEIVLTDEKVSPGETSESFTAVMRMEDLAGLIQGSSAVKLPKEAEQAVDRAKRALGVLTMVGGRIAAVTPVDEIIDAILDVVFEATPAERAALLLWDDDAARLVPKRTRQRSGQEAPNMTVSQSLIRSAFEKKSVVQMDPRIEPSASMHQLRLRSAVGVPLLGVSRPVGVIYADTSLLTGAFDPFGMALLSALASQAAIALEQSRLMRKARQEERWREQLERYLPRAVVDRMLAAGGDSQPGLLMAAEEADATVVFCDMAGFTSRTEDMEPAAVLLLLNRCFSHMTEVVQDQGGTVDKYIGDALMAVFGAPLAQADHARRAALASLGLRDTIQKINAESADLELGFRIGMHSGKVIAGDVGHVTRRNWTVIGSTVNLASRMESYVAQPGQIVLTGDTRAQLGDEFELRPVEVAKLPKGIKRGFEAYELLGVRKG
jgi:adenylate cyclase